MANSAGLFGPIYLLPVAYKIAVTDSAAVSIYTQDNVSPPTTLSTFQMDLVQVTAQHANIAPANFANCATTGMYQLNYYFEVTASDAGAGNLDVQFAFTDSLAGPTTVTKSIAQNATGRTSGTIVIYSTAASIAWRADIASGAYGTARFNLRMQLLRFY